MYKKLKIVVSLLTVALLFFTQLATPITALGAGVKVERPNELHLFQVKNSVELDEQMTILEDTYFYGKRANDEAIIQFADSEIGIPLDAVEAVEVTETSPRFTQDFVGLVPEPQVLAEGASLFSIEPDDATRILITEAVEYPVYQNEQGLDVVYIGNIEFYLDEDSRALAAEPADEEEVTSEAETEEVSEEEEAVEEVESLEEATQDESADQAAEEPAKETAEESDAEEAAEDEAVEEAEGEASVASVKTAAVDPWANSSSNYFLVTEEDTIVYDNRGSSLKPIGTLEKNQVYPRVSDYGNWHRIQYGNIYGYVRKAETVPANANSINNENKGYTNQARTFTAEENVIVYDNTSGSLVPFGTINKGQAYPIVSDYGNWWRIVFADRVGYVRKSEVETDFTKSDKFFRADGDITVYDNRGSSLKPVGKLKKGQAYPRVSDYGNWHRIQFDTFYGYVRKSETSIHNGSGIRNISKGDKSLSRKFTALEDVKVYDNTSGSLVSYGVIPKGQTYTIASDYGNWWEVTFAGRTGYVAKDEVKVNFKAGDKYFRVLRDTPVYDNRGAALEEIGELREGQAFELVRDYGNWWRVNFGDIYGYVRKSDTSFAVRSEIKNLNQNYRTSDDRFLTKRDTIVYDNSSGNLVPMGVIKEDVIYPIVSDYGNWWRVIYLDRVGYVRKSDVNATGVTYTDYNLSLSQAVNKQMSVRPQTDVYTGKIYVHWSAFDSISPGSKKGKLKKGHNVRTGPGTNHHILYTTPGARNVTLASSNYVRDKDGAKWWEITRSSLPTWINAPKNRVQYYLNPANFVNDKREQFQFLDLSKSSNAKASDLNKLLNGKGILHNMGSTFIRAALTHDVNEVYLVSHALLETGNGTSRLANGIEHNGVTVYNMYGIGAYDNCPDKCGAERAYEEGWTTPEKAIIGGAKYIGDGYVNAGQNTLYKMRWNPAAMQNGNPSHQYATDIGWASKQTRNIYNLYQQLDSYLLLLDIPVYK